MKPIKSSEKLKICLRKGKFLPIGLIYTYMGYIVNSMSINRASVILAMLLVVGAVYSAPCADICASLGSHNTVKVDKSSEMPCHQLPDDSSKKTNKECDNSSCAQILVYHSSHPNFFTDSIQGKDLANYSLSSNSYFQISLLDYFTPIRPSYHFRLIRTIPIYIRVQSFLI